MLERTGDIPSPHQQTAATKTKQTQELSEGKIISAHLFFDQVELLTQLGVAPAGTGSGS